MVDAKISVTPLEGDDEGTGTESRDHGHRTAGHRQQASLKDAGGNRSSGSAC